MRFTTSEIASATSGNTTVGDVVLDGATQDTRAIQPGQLFIPLVAERDGHDFIPSAIANGAGAYLTHRADAEDGYDDSVVAIRVQNTTAAMNDLALAARARISGPVIGITGSVGKTSTKDLLAGAVRQTFTSHWSAKSFNNEIGVPLTLINSADDSELLIIEMGARGIGHIERLCNVASPTIGIITTVAGAHTGEFGSLDNIALAKGELVEALPAQGLAVLNGDNRLVTPMAKRTSASTLTFGLDSSSDVSVSSVELDDELRATFTIDSDWGRVTAKPPTRGAHMATNVAAAVATALWLGVSAEAIEQGISTAEISPWRMDVQRSVSGALVINDSYNANPTSMAGAIDSLQRLPHERKIAVLGYMGELGPDEAEDHRKVASLAHDAGAEVVAVGTPLYGVRETPTAEAALDAIGAIGPDTAVLVKGSRSAGLELLAKQILGR